MFVTIDSDSEILPDTLRHLVSPFILDARVGAVAGNVRVLNLGDSFIPKMLEVSFACRRARVQRRRLARVAVSNDHHRMHVSRRGARRVRACEAHGGAEVA